jgi:hypothetical protein
MLLKRTSRICALGGTRRFLVVAAMIAVIAAAASAAAAGDLAATWRTIAQRAAFPVYRPLQTVGVRFDGVTLARYTGCLLASWGNPQSHAGPHFMIYEPGDTSRCGRPGVANEVATATINGVNVEVLAQCAAWPKCTVKDGETNGILLLFVPERAGKRYTIQLQSTHVSLQHFLKIARSFTRVRAGPSAPPPGPPTRHLAYFRSPEGDVYCNISRTSAFCDTANYGGQGFHGGNVVPSGAVTICNHPHSGQYCGALGGNFPVLEYGEHNDLNGFICSSAQNGITCVVASGPNSGRGFRINRRQALTVGPSTGAAAAAERFSSCGDARSLRYPVHVQVHRVSCSKSRSILRAYFSGHRSIADTRAKGFRGWFCDSGTGSGGCVKGRKALAGSGVPEIDFYYL